MLLHTPEVALGGVGEPGDFLGLSAVVAEQRPLAAIGARASETLGTVLNLTNVMKLIL